MKGAVAYILSKVYTDNSLKGISGTLAGKNCTISKTEEVEGGTNVTFTWTADDGTKKNTTIFVKDGGTRRVRLTSEGDDIRLDGVVQTFEQIRDLIMDEQLLVTLNLWDNMAFLPSSYDGNAIWFDSGFIMENIPTQMRVIINDQNQVKVDQIDLATKESVQNKVLKLNTALSESDLLNLLATTHANFKCSGFFYNTDIDDYCEFEGLYVPYKVGSETVHFGYCHMKGLHGAEHYVDYYIDDEDGGTWHKKTVNDYIAISTEQGNKLVEKEDGLYVEEPKITSTDINFYIDYENGSDDNDGLTEEAPLKTLNFQKIASAYNQYTRFGFNLMSDYPETVEILNAGIVIIKSNGASASTPLENNYTLKGGIYFGNVAEAFIQFVNVSSENNTSGVLVDFQNCGMAYLGYSKVTYSRNSNGRAVRALKCSGVSFNGIEIKNNSTRVLYGITVGTSCVYMLQGSKLSSIDSSVDYGYSFVDGGGIVYIPSNTYKQITPKALQDGTGAIFVDGQLVAAKYENTYEGERIDLQSKPTVKSSTPSGGAYTKPSGVTTAVQGGCAYGDKYVQLFNTGYFGIYSIKDFDKGTNSKSPTAYGQLGSYGENNHSNSLTFGNKYSDSDDFPLLYSTGYRDSIDSVEQLGSCCNVDRLISNGSGYTSEHIQTIYIDYSTYAGTKYVETFHYHNYLVDIENGYLYTFAPKWRSNGSQSEHDSENRYYLTRFKIPEITNPTVVLTANDILSQFELPYDATFTQGATIHNGFLYHVFGQGNSMAHPNCIRVYNLMTGKESAKIDCSKFNWQTREPESLTVYDNKLLVMVQNMYIHYLQFA